MSPLKNYFRLEGTVNRYRKLDMTVGEKEMAIAELQAKYVKLENLSSEQINRHMSRQTLKDLKAACLFQALK